MFLPRGFRGDDGTVSLPGTSARCYNGADKDIGLMKKRLSEVAWWLAAVAAGVLLALALLLIAWSVHKPWLPGYLDLRLREVWLADTFASAVASFLLALNLGAASRGQYHW